MSVWGGLIVADLLDLVEYMGRRDPDAEGDMTLAEVLQPIAAGRGVNLPGEDAQLLAAMRLYGTPTNCHCRAAIVVVDGVRPGVSAGPAGVIESDGDHLYLARWDMEYRHKEGWLPPRVASIGRGRVA